MQVLKFNEFLNETLEVEDYCNDTIYNTYYDLVRILYDLPIIKELNDSFEDYNDKKELDNEDIQKLFELSDKYFLEKRKNKNLEIYKELYDLLNKLIFDEHDKKFKEFKEKYNKKHYNPKKEKRLQKTYDDTYLDACYEILYEIVVYSIRDSFFEGIEKTIKYSKKELDTLIEGCIEKSKQ